MYYKTTIGVKSYSMEVVELFGMRLRIVPNKPNSMSNCPECALYDTQLRCCGAMVTSEQIASGWPCDNARLEQKRHFEVIEE
jgi:hypothetical protein